MTEPPKLEDLDPVETQEWLESIDSVLKTHGPERAHFLLERLIDYTRRSGAYLPFKPNRSEEHTSELQSRLHLVCRLLLEKKNIRPRLMPKNRLPMLVKVQGRTGGATLSRRNAQHTFLSPAGTGHVRPYRLSRDLSHARES